MKESFEVNGLCHVHVYHVMHCCGGLSRIVCFSVNCSSPLLDKSFVSSPEEEQQTELLESICDRVWVLSDDF